MDRRLLLKSMAGAGTLLGACGLPLLNAQASEGPNDRATQKQFGIDYLEGLKAPGALNPKMAFLAPSEIDAAYSHVLYVNTARKGGAAQKMWVLERKGQGWDLATFDKQYWDEKGEAPTYSWPVSTGRKYPGELSGPTPTGIFNFDDRNARHRKGWGSPGMYNSIYIDLHYSSGRASGIAMHGTPKSKYRLLGRVDSHGCIRMRQDNSQLVWDMFHPGDVKGEKSPFWGEVPRYFRSKPSPKFTTRRGYVRTGEKLYDKKSGALLTKMGYTALFVFFRDDV